MEMKDLSDYEFQKVMLQNVSRTFALTIPQLPVKLSSVVSNAYLLFRIVDTIEDEVSLSAQKKLRLVDEFFQVAKTNKKAVEFTKNILPYLSIQTSQAEGVLIQETPRVIEILHQFDGEQRSIILDCLKVMTAGMAEFQDLDLSAGLKTSRELDRYCYVVAGCVGEMLAKLFCYYSPEIAKNQEQLLQLSIAFGQGLQMTNILKDVWEDRERGVCWLPQDVFLKYGFDLKNLGLNALDANFDRGFRDLIKTTQLFLDGACKYTMLIPYTEPGIRQFCILNFGMAALTLNKINRNVEFHSSARNKISRKSVRATVFASRLIGNSNLLLNLTFRIINRLQ